MALNISRLHVTVEKKPIVTNATFKINPGELHVLMGPNGSGKSTVALALMGHPRFQITSGTLSLDGTDCIPLAAHERAKAGLFLSFQNPSSIPGCSVEHFIRASYNALHATPADPAEFRKRLLESMRRLGLGEQLADRSINEGFSGGEKKRIEALQLMLIKPKYAICDEVDSGLDVDAIKQVVLSIEEVRKGGVGILMITHNPSILSLVTPDHVHIMKSGAITVSGGKELIQRIEREGFEAIAR